MYSVRLGNLKDVPDLYAMSVSHYLSSSYPFRVDEEYGKRFLNAHLQNSDALTVLLERDGKSVGCLLAHAQLHPFLPEVCGTELLWWVDNDARGYHSLKLLDAFEYWAIHIKKCTILTCAGVVSHPIGTIYKRRGYKLQEQSWVKVIK